jgi:thioredoxin-related protein
VAIDSGTVSYEDLTMFEHSMTNMKCLRFFLCSTKLEFENTAKLDINLRLRLISETNKSLICVIETSY